MKLFCCEPKTAYRKWTQQGWLVHLTLLGLTLYPVASSAAEAEKAEFFEKRIRPILAQECYECHSEAHKAKGGLLLDTRAGWKKGGDSGASIVPGNPDASLLLQSIRHEHEDLEMPKAGAKLEDSVIADFTKWIADGAVDPRDAPPTEEEIASDTEWSAISARRAQWWSFQPVKDPDIPPSENVKHAVDRFLQLEHEANSITVSPLADQWTILRRLHYVLTGLPATVDEMDAFGDDWETLGREKAVARKVEELLASPHFGERWAQHWLDWFRYTEGHGGQGDPTNESAHEFRDYIIRALNENVSYRQLIREHLAGDLLEEPRLDPTGTINESIIGLAQYRFVEHGFFPVDALDELVKFTDNQIDVVSKATMGLTVSCARCHNHKFDAISHEDYHALFGIFASSRPGHRPILAPGSIDAKREELISEKEELARAIKSSWLIEASSETIRERLLAFAQTHESLEKNPKDPIKTLAGPVPIPQNLLVKAGDALEPWIRWTDGAKIAAFWNGLPARLEQMKADAEAHNERVTVAQYDFREGIPDGWRVTDGTVTRVGAGEIGMGTDEERVVESILPSGVISHAATAHEHAAMFSEDFTITFGAVAAEWSGAGWPQFRMVSENFPRPGGIYKQHDTRRDGNTRWFATDADFWDGHRGYFQFNTRYLAPAPPRGPRGADGKPIPTKAQPHGSWFHVREVRQLRSEKNRVRRTEFPAFILTKTRTEVPQDREELAGVYVDAIRETVERWLTPAFSDEDALFLTECLRAGLLSGDMEGLGKRVEERIAGFREVERSFAALAKRSVPGVVESSGFDQPFYHRGNHQNPGKPIPRGFLTALQPDPFELQEETGRLQLAQQITSDENPFFSRIIANRIWKHVFGEGLVRTPDNFGRTGQQPTHPELLDHLASRMKETDFDIKEAIRYLVMTDLFQRSNQPGEKAKSTDPENRLWTHAKLRRFDAEIVRDHLLSVAGRLSPKLYGPPVVPTMAHPQDTRRGLYVARKRKGRNPFLDTFDMPLPTTTRGQRDVTTTPSQAITMLNSPFVRHQAKAWAEANQKNPVSDNIRNLLKRAYSRQPDESEVATLTEFYHGNGEGVSGLTEVAHLVFNSKEFIYLR